MAFAILQLDRYKDVSQVKGWGQHGQFLLEVPGTNQEADVRPLLDDLTYQNTLTELEKRIETVREDGNHIQSNSIKAVEVLLTTTLKFDDTNQQLDPQKLQTEWLEQTKKFLRDEFGHRLITVYEHLDPESPHVHGLITPTIREDDSEAQSDQTGLRLCFGDLYGNHAPQSPSALRSTYDEYLKDLELSVLSGSHSLSRVFDDQQIDELKDKQSLIQELKTLRSTLSDPDQLLDELLDESTVERIRELTDSPVDFIHEALERHLKSEDPNREVIAELNKEVPEKHLEATRNQCGEPWESYYNPETGISYHFMGDGWRKTEETSFGQLKPFEVGIKEIRKKVFGQDPEELSSKQRRSIPTPN